MGSAASTTAGNCSSYLRRARKKKNSHSHADTDRSLAAENEIKRLHELLAVKEAEIDRLSKETELHKAAGVDLASKLAAAEDKRSADRLRNMRVLSQVKQVRRKHGWVS